MMGMILIGLKQFGINYNFTVILYLTASIAYMKGHCRSWGMKRDFMGICAFEARSIILSVRKNLLNFL